MLSRIIKKFFKGDSTEKVQLLQKMKSKRKCLILRPQELVNLVNIK